MIRTNRANCANDTDIVKLQFNGISVGISSSVFEDFSTNSFGLSDMLKDADFNYFAGVCIVCGYTDLHKPQKCGIFVTKTKIISHLLWYVYRNLINCGFYDLATADLSVHINY